MKTKLFILIWLQVSVALVQAQGFVNLNFEQANNLGSPGSQVNATNAFPGWSVLQTNAYVFTLYDFLTHGSPSVNILDTNAIDQAGFNFNPIIGGRYTAVLQGTFTYRCGIYQTGVIPASAVTLLFSAYGISPYSTFNVSLDGQNLNYVPLSTGVNYTLYGADISAFTGQTATLTFYSNSTITGSAASNVFLDNIQFSTVAVPEPQQLAWMGLGAGCWLWRARLARGR